MRTLKGAFTLEAEPCHTYYVVISPRGFVHGGVSFVSAAEGEKIRKNLSLNPDRWLLRQYYSNWASVRLGMTLEEVQHLVRLSERASITKVGGKRPFHGMAKDGSVLLVEVGRTDKSTRSCRCLGIATGIDSHGCPAASMER
jgi:hypothetical protein